MEQRTEEAIQQPVEQVELLGMLVAQEYETLIDEMFSLMLEPEENEPEDGALPQTRAAGN